MQLSFKILIWVCNVLFIFETISLVLTVLMAFWRMRLDPFFAYPNKTRWVSHTRHSVNTCWIYGKFHFLFSSIIHTFIIVKAKNKNKNGLTCLKITLPQIARENQYSGFCDIFYGRGGEMKNIVFSRLTALRNWESGTPPWIVQSKGLFVTSL